MRLSHIHLLFLLGMFFLAGPIHAATADGSDKPLDVSTLITNDEQLKSEVEDVGAGDQKAFPIRTEDNIAALEVGDVYRNDQRTYFKVIKIDSKGQRGGSFVFARTNGTSDAGQRFQRVKGSGPATITASLTLIDLYVQGGMALHPIALLGIATIVLSINCFWIFRRRRQIDRDLVKRGNKLLKDGDVEGFAELANERRGLLAVICRSMVVRWKTSTIEDIKERVGLTASAQINRLRLPVRTLNVISVAAPLLGLLGTIIGMVIVFEGVASSTGAAKAAILAAGIRVKLFSTAFALFVAIPSLFSFFFFNSHFNNLISEVELISEEFLHRIAVLKRRQARSGNKEDEEDEEEDDEITEKKGTSNDSSEGDADEEDLPKKSSGKHHHEHKHKDSKSETHHHHQSSDK